jgi:hypothetical protein
MWRVTTFCTEQYGKCRLSTIKDSGESIKNRKYFLEFEAKFESLQISSTWLGRIPFLKKLEAKNIAGLSL